MPRTAGINLSAELGGGRALRPEVRSRSEVTPREALAARRSPADNARLHARGLAQAASVPATRTERHWVERGPNPIGYDEPYEMGFTGFGDAGGRIVALAVDPKDPDTVWAGTTAAGIWRSTDAGRTWTSFLQEPSPPTVGAIVIEPATGTVHVGTGEPNFNGAAQPGVGILRSRDGGRSWQRASGIPAGAHVMRLALAGTDRIFAATNRGLLMSNDGGASYSDVELPTDAAGTAPYTATPYGSVVTDVVVHPDDPNRVTAAVGWDSGRTANPESKEIESVGNGLYRSEEGGGAGTWSRLDAPTFGRSTTSGDPIGRTTLAYATGPDQDHDVLWALIQDAGMYSQKGLLDLPAATTVSLLNGVYRSPDDGETWELEGESQTLSNAQDATLADLVPTVYPAGIQAWYNQFLVVDPTDEKRVLVGLEEVYEPTSDPALPGPSTWRAVARYWSDCRRINGLSGCTADVATGPKGPTPHPDHHSVAVVPTADGVRFYDGNDGGLYVQDVPTGGELVIESWQARNVGLRAAKPYYAVMDSAGNIVAGLQDNGTTRTRPGSTRGVVVHGGDGAGVAVHPTDPDIIYAQYQFAGFGASTDGGETFTYAPPPDDAPFSFIAPMALDSADADHLVLGSGAVVHASVSGPTTRTEDWVPVFDLRVDTPGQRATSVDVHSGAVYATWCANCFVPYNDPGQTRGGVSTNVAAGCALEAGTAACWRQAPAKGLPDRQLVSDVAIDRRNVRRVVVTLGDYQIRWHAAKRGQGRVFLSTDGAESFSDISRGLPDVPANSVVLRGEEIYVATDVGVFVAPRAGEGFTRLGAGLPTAQVLDVTLNPQQDTLVASTHGRGVFTFALDGAAPLTPPRPASRPAPLPATGVNPWLAALGALLLGIASATRRGTTRSTTL